MSISLVLEGGGQRGAYTAGVLQALYSEGIKFDYIIGVSAGALTAASFISGQPRRNYATFVDYAQDERYMGFSHYRDKGGVFNFDFVLGELVYDIIPLDFDAFFSDPARFVIGTTDIRTGGAAYFDKEALMGDHNLTVLRASASLPLVSKPVRFRGMTLMDGGLSDPIPLERSIEDGNEYSLIVLTRNPDFVAGRTSLMKLNRRFYSEYPNFIETLETRHILYERQRQLAYERQRLGKAVVLAPQAPLRVGRYERRRERLAALYDQALVEVAARIADIRALCKKALHET